ncbi:MAG: hypothetical protein XD81_1626 [Bacteroidetes bacterium 38_7]|nr:MAG: hypothetical protein XD81_1626 [Bacteroidetes bacterium 38_7]
MIKKLKIILSLQRIYIHSALNKYLSKLIQIQLIRLWQIYIR